MKNPFQFSHNFLLFIFYNLYRYLEWNMVWQSLDKTTHPFRSVSRHFDTEDQRDLFLITPDTIETLERQLVITVLATKSLHLFAIAGRDLNKVNCSTWWAMSLNALAWRNVEQSISWE